MSQEKKVNDLEVEVAGLIDKIDGMVTATASDAFHYILREPLGVVGAIVPWNYPLLMAAWKVAPIGVRDL